MRERELVETLRVRALPEGSYDHDNLVEFLRLYRDAVQTVVNRLWALDKIPSIGTLHRMLYGELRAYGLRAHHVKQVYVYARAIVKATRKNGGKKPVLRRLTARVDGYDYKLDLENRTLVLKVHDGGEVRLKLLVPKERVEKFKGWSNYEIAVKHIEGSVYVAVYFRKTVKTSKTRNIMTVDINFDNITLVVFKPNGDILRLKRFKTPLRKMLTHRIWIERTQKRYPRPWKFVKGIGESIRKHGERIENIAWDYAHKIGDRVAELAREHNAVVVLENLSHLRDNAGKGSGFNKRLSLWFYRRVRFTIGYEALERGLEVKHINPRGTSSTCPGCGSRLKDDGNRVLYRTSCGFIGDRDVVACVNLFLRHPRCGGPGVPRTPPSPMRTRDRCGGTRDEAMKMTPELNPAKVLGPILEEYRIILVPVKKVKYPCVVVNVPEEGRVSVMFFRYREERLEREIGIELFARVLEELVGKERPYWHALGRRQVAVLQN